VAHSFPDKARTFFLHVPKTGGTTVRERIIAETAIPAWSIDYQRVSEFTDEIILQMILRFMRQATTAEELLFCGHFDFDYLASNGLLSRANRYFTVVRDPREIVISGLNYVFTRIINTPHTAGSQVWLAKLRLEADQAPKRREDVTDRMLTNLVTSDTFRREFSNIMFRFYGGTERAEECIDNLASCGFEVVFNEDLNGYLAERFGIAKLDIRKNASRKFFTRADFDIVFRDFDPQEICGLDVAVYALLSGLKRSGTALRL
jgi:hypothetical protein